MIEADQLLAQRLQAKEQERLTNAEKARLFCDFLYQRRKFFAAKSVEEKKNKPPTQAQQRKLYCNYLKNMEGYTLKQLKGFKFEVIKDMFDKDFRRVNIFVDYKTELLEESSKKAEAEKESNEMVEAAVDDDQEEAKMKEHVDIVPDEEEVAIDAIPLATKPPCIIDWKNHKDKKKSYFQIIKVDGSSNIFLTFSVMLRSFDREDLETLWNLVKARFKSTKLVDDLDLILCWI
ncbi:hypothetical protein Tco_0553135 [Tanacetum coccineum]